MKSSLYCLGIIMFLALPFTIVSGIHMGFRRNVV